MLGFKKHIAVLLFGIFFFPLAYQPLHVFLHHAQKTHCHHNCCHSKLEKKFCSHGPSINTTSEKEEACPICDYHFPINILPKVFIYPYKKAVIESEIVQLKIRLPFQQIISIKTPRAPPIV